MITWKHSSPVRWVYHGRPTKGYRWPLGNFPKFNFFHQQCFLTSKALACLLLLSTKTTNKQMEVSMGGITLDALNSLPRGLFWKVAITLPLFLGSELRRQSVQEANSVKSCYPMFPPKHIQPNCRRPNNFLHRYWNLNILP